MVKAEHYDSLDSTHLLLIRRQSRSDSKSNTISSSYRNRKAVAANIEENLNKQT
jgi:hypothetical protein